MTDMQSLFEKVDSLSPEEIRQLLEYIVENHMRFVATNPPVRVEPTTTDEFNPETPLAE